MERNLAATTGGALIIAASAPQAEHSVRERPIRRTFAGTTPFDPHIVTAIIRQTAQDQETPIVVGADRAEDALLSQLKGLAKLRSGWDGEDADKPSAAAIASAMGFVILAGALAAELDSSPHVDGSIILESEAGLSLRFFEGGKIAYASLGHGCGEANFDGARIPSEIARLLG